MAGGRAASASASVIRPLSRRTSKPSIRVGWFSEETNPGIRWKIATLVALTLMSLHFYFGSIRDVLNHYKVLTVGAVLLLVCLAQIKPKLPAKTA